jgi:hypothetical protein
MSYLRASDSQASYLQGFHFELLPIPLIMPFNYQSHKLIDDLSRSLSRLPESERASAAAKVPDCNVSVFLSSSKDGMDKYTVGRISTDDHQRTELRVGASQLPKIDYVFSNPKRFGQNTIPGTILITAYSQALSSNKQPVSKPAKSYLLSLTKAVVDAPSDSEMSIDGDLKSGMLVSYVGQLGQGGVRYDSGSGSFSDQLSKQMAIDNRHYGQLIQGAPPRVVNRASSAPIILSAVFAIIAALLLVASRRRPHASR